MASLRATLVQFPGGYGFAEAERFCQELGMMTSTVSFEAEKVPDTDLVVLPSGATFGDYIRPGALAARTNICAAIKSYARSGGKVLGIANGFQILCEMKLLPGVLITNQGVNFRNVQTYVRYEGGEELLFKNVAAKQYFPVPFVCKFGAYFANKRDIQDIEEQKLVFLRYVDQFGVEDEDNPFAGSLKSIAGLKNAKGNVIGIMPRVDRIERDLLAELLAPKN